MSVLSMVLILLLIFVIFGMVIWLLQKIGKSFQKWNDVSDIPTNLSQMTSKNKSQATSNKSQVTSKKKTENLNSDNFAGKMVERQNRKSKLQRTKIVPAESDEKGVQYSPDGPLFHTRHYRTSHFTDDLVSEPHNYRVNNKTYGSKNFDNYRSSKQKRKNTKQAGKKSGKNQTMMDSIANSYAENMKYSAGYQQAMKRSKK